MAPEWAELATNLKGEVKVAKVDATENKNAGERFGVRGYPTIKFFPAGKKDESSAIDYEGGRNAAAMAEWAREKTKDLKHWEHVRLTSQSQYDEYCAGRSNFTFMKTSVLSPSCHISSIPHKKKETTISRRSKK